jgi:hypothetical protein
MSVGIQRVSDERVVGLDGTWNDHVERSPMATLFHRYEVLDLLASHTDARLHRLVGHKGDEIIGLFPLFEYRKGPVTALFSPPPKLAVPNLGPSLANYQKLKQHKYEHTNGEFVRRCLEWADAEFDPQYVHFETPVGYDDPRPFVWDGFDVEPRFTYTLDVSGGPDAVMQNFKQSRRKDIKRHLDADYRIREGGVEAIEFVLDEVDARYDEQGKTFGVDPEYVVDLYETLPEGTVRPYVADVDGAWRSGVVTLEHGDRVMWWFGAGKPDVDLPLTDLLHWRIITDAIDRGVTTCDLVGANTERIVNFKSKYNPDLAPYYEIERGTRMMNLASDLYRRFS